IRSISLFSAPGRGGGAPLCSVRRACCSALPLCGALRRRVLLISTAGGAQVQRQALPATLLRGQRLTAPLAVHPGKAVNPVHLAIEFHLSISLVKGLAVIVRSLPLA